MESRYTAPDLVILETAGRIARATHLWLRRRNATHGTSYILDGSFNDERRAQWLVAGFISELCENLQLTTQHAVLAAYTYALLDESWPDSMEIAAILFEARSGPQSSVVFAEGRSLVGEMLGLLEDSSLATVLEEDFD